MRSSGLQRVPDTPGTSGFSGQERQAHIRLSKLRAWKLPNSRGRMCRTCVHSPAMQAESAVNAVATPMEAPTWPPWVASSAGLAQVSGAHEPAMVGSQPESPVPQASTVPPPVTRQPDGGTHACGGGLMSMHPCVVSHTWQTGLLHVTVWSKQVGNACADASQLAFSQALLTILQPLLVLSKQVGKEEALASQLAFSHTLWRALQPLLVLSKQVGKACAAASQLAFSQPLMTALQPLLVLSKQVGKE